ncbi:MAG: hypothetical protein ABGW78_12660 [Pirellulales bacterium]
MDPTTLLLRWAHILGAVLALGGLAFARFGLLPALADFDEETRVKIHESIRRRWLPWVILAITLLLVSGLANFLLFNRLVKEQGWGGGTWMQQTSYHALFGVKFLLAMGVFYFSSGLVGRGRGTQWIRDNRSTWLTITLGMAIGIVIISGCMRQLHTGPNIIPDDGGVSMEEKTGSEEASPARYQDGAAGSSFRNEEQELVLPGADADPAQKEDTPSEASSDETNDKPASD